MSGLVVIYAVVAVGAGLVFCFEAGFCDDHEALPVGLVLALAWPVVMCIALAALPFCAALKFGEWIGARRRPTPNTASGVKTGDR